MDKQTTQYYKLMLAHDLVMYLMNLYINKVPPEHKAKTSNVILENWEKSLSEQIDKTVNEAIKNTVEMENMGDDEMAIMASVHRMEPEIIRKEFKDDVIHNIFRSFNIPKT